MSDWEIYGGGHQKIYGEDASGNSRVIRTSEQSRIISDVYLQDQTSAPVVALMNRTLGVVTLASDTTLDATAVVLVAGHSAVAGEYLVFREGTRYYQGKILNVATNTITLDTPLDYAFTTAAEAELVSVNLGVNGSGGTITFKYKPPPSVQVDITKVIISIIDDAAMDESKFGGIAALTKGVVLRKKNDVVYNIGNAKTNGEIRGFCYNADYTDKTGGGLYGFVAECDFAGQDNLGVTIRLDGATGDELQMLVQDDISAVSSIRVVVTGHVVED